MHRLPCNQLNLGQSHHLCSNTMQEMPVRNCVKNYCSYLHVYPFDPYPTKVVTSNFYHQWNLWETIITSKQQNATPGQVPGQTTYWTPWKANKHPYTVKGIFLDTPLRSTSGDKYPLHTEGGKDSHLQGRQKAYHSPHSPHPPGSFYHVQHPERSPLHTPTAQHTSTTGPPWHQNPNPTKYVFRWTWPNKAPTDW